MFDHRPPAIKESNPEKVNDLFPQHLYVKKDEQDEQLRETGMTIIEQITSKQDKEKPQVQLGSDTTQDSYLRVPIEDFGKSVMAKLGWKEEEKKPLGRNP